MKKVLKISDFNRETISSHYENLNPNTLFSVWTPEEVELLTRVSPIAIQELINLLELILKLILKHESKKQKV
jgi:hypothetical protein